MVYHQQAVPEEYDARRGDRPAYYQRWLEMRDLDRREAVGGFYTLSDRLVYEFPSTAAWWARRAGRIAQRAVRERRLRT